MILKLIATLITFVMIGFVIYLSFIFFQRPSKDSLHLTFKQFITFYNLCPDRFKLDDDCPGYRDGVDWNWIYFSLLDQFLYKIFWRRYNRNKYKNMQDKKQIRFLRIMKSEIGSKEELAQIEFERANNKLQELIKERKELEGLL